MKHKYRLAFLITWTPMMLSLRIPPVPCPNYFGYYKDEQGKVYGSAELPYDKSPWLVFSVNASFLGKFDQPELRLEKVTKLHELNDGTPTVKYNIFFPFTDVIPKITDLTYNGKIYCRGSPELLEEGSPGVTNVRNQTYFMFSQQEYGFYAPETQPDTSDDVIPVQSLNEKPTVLQPLSTTIPPKVRPLTPKIPQFHMSRVTPTQDINTSNNPTTEISINLINDLFITPFTCGVAAGNESGATETKLGQYPWLVALFWQRRFSFNYKCSATLISDKHVLTAARCFQYNDDQLKNIAEIFLVMGTNNLDNWKTNGAITRTASRVDVHPNYKKNKESAHGDIAIILLNRRVQFTDVIKPVCLWKGDTDLYPLTHKMGVIAGFGQNENSPQEGLTHFIRAKQVNMPIVAQTECFTSPLGLQDLISDKTFCTKSDERQLTGPCKGDTGAGFFISMYGAYYLRGIASVIPFKDGNCDLTTRYVAFCDAAKFSDWIKSHMT
ncbi:unnamed protein product [Diabrotica balteata]|uniref:Peptidase S1 domain-containing protein n=1 Tax=Diabrotica balteata TaxID=107213 RepID=A0A9N9T0T0_DIABA|nr:unnamed protein product [Diabrotica balteata]